MKIQTQCHRCGTQKTLTVSEEAYKRWQSGEFVQNAFPDMSADDREALISGTCPKCWEAMFAEE